MTCVFYRYGYSSSIAFDVAHKLESCQNLDENNTDPQNTTCDFGRLVTTGSLEAGSALVYLITSCAVISLSEAIFRTIVPALAGDQVSVSLLTNATIVRVTITRKMV